MTTSVIVRNDNNDDEQEEGILVNCIENDGSNEKVLLKAGQEHEFYVYPGRGAVIEAVSLAEPDPDAKVLTDEVEVKDSTS